MARELGDSRPVPLRDAQAARRAALTYAVLAALSCGDPLSPERQSSEFPEVIHAEIETHMARDGGVLRVLMTPADFAYRLPQGRFLLATATSSAGELEEVRVRRYLCPYAEYPEFLCQEFSVRVFDGLDVRDIEQAFWARDARLTSVSPTARTGWGYAFADLEGTMRALRLHPNVRWVERSGLFYPTATGDPPPGAAILAGAIPFEVGTCVPGDGILTADPGDTIRFSYLSSLGTSKVAEFVFLSP